MTSHVESDLARRAPLTSERVLRTAVALADEHGIESLSMRKLALALDVVPMALYRHVANKEDLLNGLVDVILGEIDPVRSDVGWKSALRERILSARRVLLRHPWASKVLESRGTPTPLAIGYVDSMIGVLRRGGFSIELGHHAVHAMGSRLFGFTQELFTDVPKLDEGQAEMLEAMAGAYPYVHELMVTISHDDTSVVGRSGCDDQFEFEFALDLMLDGLERLKDSG